MATAPMRLEFVDKRYPQIMSDDEVAGRLNLAAESVATADATRRAQRAERVECALEEGGTEDADV